MSGPKSGPTASKMTPEQMAEAIELYRAGWTIRKIGAKFGISKHPLHLRFIKAGVEFRGTGAQKSASGPLMDQAAQHAVQSAVAAGALVRPEACSECGSTKRRRDGITNIVGHHDDYNKPLEVRWLCNQCHRRWHMTNTAIAKRAETGAQHAE